MLHTVARAKLVEWLSASGRSQSELARALEVRQSAVSLWVRGHARPEPPLREAIEHVTGIPSRDWWTESETELVTRVRASTKRTATRRRASGTTTRPPRTGTEG